MLSVRTLPCGNWQQSIPEMSSQPMPGDFTRDNVLDILNAAHVETSRRYADTPDLYDALQSLLQSGLEDCNLRDVDPMQVLHEQMRGEWRILDAYNKHRLGRAAHCYYKNFPEPENAVDYEEEDNIPEQVDWFPLRAEVVRRGFHVVMAPIYQLPGTVEHNQELSARKPTVTAKATSNAKPAPKQAAGGARQHTKKKTGRAAANYDKLADAPSAQLDLPNGNLTLAEIACFVPHSIKSWDIMDRVLHNGAFSVTLSDMINHFREMPHGPIPSNSIYRMMKGPMDKRAEEEPLYKGWTVSKHQSLKRPDNFDPASISVAGFRTPVNYSKREAAAAALGPVPTILFRNLKNGVKTMPTGSDALDLTRCVRYCVDHPDQDWYYPQDFVKLVSQLPQDPSLVGYPAGPAPVQRGHQDAHIVQKYTSIQKLNGAKQAGSRQRDGHGRLLKKEKRDFEDEDEAMDIDSSDDSDGEVDFEALDKKSTKRKRNAIDDDSDEDNSPSTFRNHKREKLSSRTPHHGKFVRSKAPLSRLRNEITADDIDSESDSDVYQGPKKKSKKTTTPARTSGRTKHFIGSYSVDAALKIDDEEDTPDMADEDEEMSDSDAFEDDGE